VLPPVGLTCRNGHPFSTTAKSGQSIPCPRCGVSVWIGKYVRGRQAAARPSPSRVNGNALAVRTRPQTAPGARVLDGVVIPPPTRTAAEPAGPDLSRKHPARTGRKREPEPGYGQHLQPALGPWCDVCAHLGDHTKSKSGRWTVATWEAELTGDPWHARVCGSCLRRLRAMGAVTRAQELPRSRAGRPGELYRPAAGLPVEVRCRGCGARAGLPPPDACPCGRADWEVSRRVTGASGRTGSLPAAAPAAAGPVNQTIALSGVYR